MLVGIHFVLFVRVLFRRCSDITPTAAIPRGVGTILYTSTDFRNGNDKLSECSSIYVIVCVLIERRTARNLDNNNPRERLRVDEMSNTRSDDVRGVYVIWRVRDSLAGVSGRNAKNWVASLKKRKKKNKNRI